MSEFFEEEYNARGTQGKQSPINPAWFTQRVEKRFRKLDAPHQLNDVFEGRKFEDGKPVSTDKRKEVA